MRAYSVLELEGSPRQLELALVELLEHGCLGTEEISPRRLRAYLPPTVDCEFERLLVQLRRKSLRLKCRALPPEPERDWLARWKESLTGFAVGESFFVLPTWRAEPATPRTVLRLDPEQAFGTGSHDTTRLAVELLERWVRPGIRLVDVGTGTGILAMVGAILGAAPVLALEPDRAAARCARENVSRNGLSEVIEVAAAGWESYQAIRAELVVANIHTAVLRRAVRRVEAGTVILSGLLAEDIADFAGDVPSPYRVREQWTAGEWAAIVLRRAEEPPVGALA